MEPVAMSFAAIVGLLSNFKAERASGRMDEFVEWLKQSRHADIAVIIESNTSISIAIKSLLSENHRSVMEQLGQLNSIMSSIAAHLPQLAPIALAIQPTALSTQAVSVLRQFLDSGAKELRRAPGLSPQQYRLVGGKAELVVDEPRFLEEDIATLVEMKLMRLEHSSSGSPKWLITRTAEALVRAVDR